ncbi:uncharacterized protein LOC112456655 [Temnothorax curvispinosus]|uniref:Uncharacterized protein LOC112456655 n=1 Tax=Temnothorax curvispinosus TaxID=300111 RepID=A0A6J1PZ22_9HYME|nr:uncharacterized protein LOC112456655 [Temnothorax curvispinosus]
MAEQLEELEPVINPNQSFASSTMRSESASLSLMHLPPIQLPPFSGKFEEWESFRDRFKALIIKNKELSNFSKMHFLTSSLTGHARDAIASLTITAENFDVAWKALTTRFENKRPLIEIHVSALCNLTNVSRESATELHALRDQAEKALAALKRLDRLSDEILSDILVYCVSQKLDPATRRAWKLKFSDDSLPPMYDDLNRFLSSRALALEKLAPTNSSKFNCGLKVTTTNASTASNPSCPLCQKFHFINKCPKFIEKSPSQRRDIVKQNKRCFNCLSTKHAVTDCKSKFTCRTCQRQHHSMLHDDSLSSSTNLVTVSASEPSTEIEASKVNSLSAVSITAVPTPVLLATARVNVGCPSGRTLSVRAILDQGSEVSFISERLAQILRVQLIRTRTSISAVGCVKVETCRHAANICITPRDRAEPTFSTLAFIIKSLTKYISPRAKFDVEWSHLTQLNLADDDPTGADPIDILIGADLYGSIIQNGI